MAGLLSVESLSMDVVVYISNSFELPSDQLLINISRVLKPGGTVLHWTSQSANWKVVIYFKIPLLGELTGDHLLPSIESIY